MLALETVLTCILYMPGITLNLFSKSHEKVCSVCSHLIDRETEAPSGYEKLHPHQPIPGISGETEAIYTKQPKACLQAGQRDQLPERACVLSTSDETRSRQMGTSF